MRLECTEEQERELRITEIEAVLENHLRDSKIEELALEVELQFLQGNENSYGEPLAYIGIDTGETLEIIFDRNIEQFSMLIHDVEGNPMLPYYNADTVEELLEQVCDYWNFTNSWGKKMRRLILTEEEDKFLKYCEDFCPIYSAIE